MAVTHNFGRRQRGFTIVELVITVVVMGILAVVGVSMISDSFTTARMVNAGQSNANDARYAVERLAREIREIKHESKNDGYGISQMDVSKLAFKRPDDVVVTIDVDDSKNLTLNYSSSPTVTSTLATQATLTLAYLSLDPVTGATPPNAVKTNVRFVEITLTLKDDTSNKGITERSRVALRNMCDTNPCI